MAKDMNKDIGPDNAPDTSRLGFVPGEGELAGGIPPQNEAAYFMRCPKCGSYFDTRDLNQVLLHDGPLPHASASKS
jgi:hypothetical protein